MSERNRMAWTGTALLDLAPERLIAFSRLILSAFAFVAISLDPTQPATYPMLGEGLLVAYLVYALALAVAAVITLPGTRTAVAVHAGDLLACAALMALTDGPTSPFFVFFTFALFAATLRWNWQGTLATAAVLVLLFVVLSILYVPVAGDAGELTRWIIRGGYLMVAAAILTYLGMIRARGRQRMAQLADWPPVAVTDGAFPPLEEPVRHALGVLGAERAVVFWELDEEPWLWRAACGAEGCAFEREPPAEAPLVPEALAGRSFLVLDAGRGHYRVRGQRTARERRLGARLVAECGASRAVVAPIRGEGFAGQVLLIGVTQASEDLLPLAEVVAARIGSEIQHHLLRRALEAATAVRERARLARDMHDGLLQSLTAAALQARALQNGAPEALRPRLEELQRLVGRQQRRLRAFVDDTRAPPATQRSVVDEIAPVLAEVEEQWDCATALEVDPPDAEVPGRLGAELALMVSEAAANAARHGGASSIEVKVTRRGDSLRLQIEDDGRGLPDADSRRRVAAVPRSLRERARELGGDVRVAVSGHGLRLQIEVAVP